jgi:FHA domain/RDD family/Double zinc ribbon
VAKLVVNPSASNKREIALGKTLLSIGRDPSNDVVLPDAMVSRRHAVIEFRGSQYYLRDCNSSNGSVINGDRVSEKSLRDGDMVAIGSARLLFRDEPEVEAGAKVVQHPSAPRLDCPTCEAVYRKGDVYCRSCGTRLPEPSGPPKAVCPACGTAVLLPAQFCNACGAHLPESASEGSTLPEGSPHLAGGPAVLITDTGGAPPAAAMASASSARSPASAASAPPSPGSSAVAAPAAAVAPVAPGTPVGAAGYDLVTTPPATDPGGPRSEGALARVKGVLAEPLKAPALDQDAVRRTPSAGLPGPAARPAPRVGAAAAVPPVSASVQAPPGLRALAASVDLGLILGLQALVFVPLVSYWWSREVPGRGGEVQFTPVLLSLVAAPVALLLAAAYFIWSWGVTGSTLGQRLLELAVESEDGRFPIGPGRAAIRLFGYLLCFLSLGVGFLLVPLTGAGLHDRLAGTRVVLRRGGAR